MWPVGGFAPGGYICKCHVCEREFIGEKRAHSCLPCAIEALKKRLSGASAQRGGEVVLVAGLGAGREVEVKLPGFYTLDASLRGALKTAPGVAYLEDV